MSRSRLRSVLPWVVLALGLPAALLLPRWPSFMPSTLPEPSIDAGGGLPPAGPTAPLSGVVRDSAGEPAAGVVVVAHEVRGRQVRSAGRVTTGEAGIFELDAVPCGFVALTARAEGRAGGPVLVNLDPGGLTEVELTVGPSAPLAGRVLHEEAGPVIGARVCAIPLQAGPVPELSTRCATTDEEGSFRLDQWAAGPHRLVATGESIARAERPEVLAPDESLEILVVRVGTVVGRVRGPDGAGVAEASVIIAGSGIWPPRQVRTERGGRYRVAGLPSGVYEIEARTGELASQRELGVEVRAGVEVVVDLDLDQGAVLSGRILSASTGEPVVGATVSVASGQLAAAPTVTRTGSSGRFSISGLAAGEHWLSVWADGHVPEVSLLQQVPGEVEVRLLQGATVRGRVVDDRGYPIEGALVEPDLPARSAPALLAAVPAGLDAQDGGELGVIPGLELIEPDMEGVGAPAGAPRGDGAAPPEGLAVAPLPSPPPMPPRPAASWPVQTGRDGTFELRGLPAKMVVLTARHRSSAMGRSDPVSLGPGATVEGVEIRLVPGVALEGRVVDDRGHPVSGALLTLQSGATSERDVTVSRDDGTFAFSPSSGTATLSAELVGHVPVALEVELGAGPGRSEIEVVLLPAVRRLAGRVLDTGGFPIEAAAVTVRSATTGSPIVRRVSTGSDGSFEVEGLAAGAVVAEASAPGRSPAFATVLPEEEEIELRLSRSGGVTVEVVDGHTGDPVERCAVVLLADSGPRRRAQCELGRAVFEDLPAGEAALQVTAEGWADAASTVVVSEGVEAHEPGALVRVELDVGVRVTGRVIDDSGEPVVGARVSLSHPPRWVTPRARGAGWVRSGGGGAFVVSGMAASEGAVVSAYHGRRGEGSAEVEPVYPGEEPEVEIVLEAGEGRPVGRHHGLALDLGRGGREGVAVAFVCPGSGAEAAGVRAGDLLHAVDGEPVRGAAGAARSLRGPRGTAVLLALSRGDVVWSVLVERELVTP